MTNSCFSTVSAVVLHFYRYFATVTDVDRESGEGGTFMNIPNDPVILLSYINTQLRDNYSSLEDLCKSLSVSQQFIEEKLAGIGYAYDVKTNSFR